MSDVVCKSDGFRDFIALAVTTFVNISYELRHAHSKLLLSDVPSAISPCGMCRQVINEFCDHEMPVLLVPSDFVTKHPEETKDNPIRVMTVGQLLPEAFGPEHLPKA